MSLTLEELKENHNSVLSVMENRIMLMAECDRKTANLVANEVLDLARDAKVLLGNKAQKRYFKRKDDQI